MVDVFLVRLLVLSILPLVQTPLYLCATANGTNCLLCSLSCLHYAVPRLPPPFLLLFSHTSTP